MKSQIPFTCCGLKTSQKQGAKEVKGVAESFLENWEKVLLSEVRKLEQNNMCVDLNDKCKDRFLSFVNLEKLKNIAVERLEGNN